VPASMNGAVRHPNGCGGVSHLRASPPRHRGFAHRRLPNEPRRSISRRWSEVGEAQIQLTIP
jgi:hypothetical protein